MLIFIQAFQLLNFLILDSSEDLRDTIRCLDPFPDTMHFKQINKSHKQLKEDRTSILEVKAFKLSRDKAKSIFVLVAVEMFTHHHHHHHHRHLRHKHRHYP